jgi:hypothetical protein
MGFAMGADFSGVTVHTDTQSDQLNRSVQAKAFTTGQDIFFRQGAYQPSSRSGQELIAHELTHVVQQHGSGIESPICQASFVKSIPIDGYEKPKPDILNNPLDTTGNEISEKDYGKKINPEEGSAYFNDTNLDPTKEQDAQLLGGMLNTPLAVFYKFQLGKNDRLEQGKSKWVFKEDKKNDATGTKANPANGGNGIEKVDAGQSIRSIATYKLDQLFGANISEKTFAAKHRQKLGFVMKFSEGLQGLSVLSHAASPFKSREDKPNSLKFKDSTLKSNTPASTKTLREGLSTMALMDIISGQVDRHGDNYLVENNTNVRAIDNDLSFVKDYQNINRGRANPNKDQNKPFKPVKETGENLSDVLSRHSQASGSPVQNIPLDAMNPTLVKKILELAEKPEEVRKALQFQLSDKEHLSRREIDATISRLRSLAKHLKWRIQRWEILNKKKWGV